MPQEFTPQYTFTDDRLNELKQLFPEAWEDGVFNVDTLKTLIGDFSTDNSVKEHFGLNWVGKQDARKIAAKPPTGTLKPCLGEGVNEDTTENIFIEGENLEVLKILRKSYMGKIKMIYIDPPYNTGTDFVYKDTFADSTEDYLRKIGEKSNEGLLVSNPKSSGKYHANWLSFIYPRIRTAKDLLTDDGVLYISIDDNEIDNLLLLCKEIFDENCIKVISVKMSESSGLKMASVKKFGTIPKLKEYVIIIKKDGIKNLFFKPLKKSSWDNEYNIFLEGLTLGDKEKINELSAKDEIEELEIEELDKIVSSITLKSVSEKIKEIDEDDKEKWLFENAWKICQSTTSSSVLKLANEKKNNNNNELFFVKSSTGLLYFVKANYSSESKKPRLQLIFADDNLSYHPGDFWSHIKTTGLDNEGSVPYKNGKKPQKLLISLLEAIQDDDSIVLDFFAGSASTAEAVLKLNKKDGGNRKFIMAQINENLNKSFEESTGDTKKEIKQYLEFLISIDKPLFLTELGKERIRQAIQSIDTSKGFKVFKQDTSTIYKWQDFKSEQDGALPDLFSKMELAYKNPIQDGVTTQDFITEVILQEGFPLTAKQEEVVSGIFKITHEWVPYTLYATMLYSFRNTDFSKIQLQYTDHFVCLDKAFEGNDALKQTIDNQCKLFTI